MSQEPSLETFDTTEYLRCSNNNMPRWTPLVPNTDEEQAMVDEALKL